MRRKFLVTFFILCSLFLIYYFLRYNVFHPVMRLSINEINNIQLNNTTYDILNDKPFIQEFITAYNKAKLNKEQELSTTPDFTLIINLTNGEVIRIQDGDTTYCYIEYNNKSVIVYSPDLIKLIESINK